MPNTKNSKQRDAILAELQGRHDHPTAEQIFSALKASIPALSLATVYRNLKVLESFGLIIRIPGNTADRFDANNEEHYHLTCKSCGCVCDLTINEPQSINALPHSFGGKVEAHALMFYGLCPDCFGKSDHKAEP